MIRLFATAAAAFSLCACAPQATPTVPNQAGAEAASDTPPTPSAALAWMVVSRINDFYDDADDPTNRPAILTEPPAGVLTSRDINGDGVADWIVKWPESTQFCGTGGCRVAVYLGVGQHLKRIFDRQVLNDLRVTQVDGETRIESSFHHGSCNEQREDCRLAWGLDAASGLLMPRPSANGDTYSSQSDEQPIDGDPDEAS